MLHRLLRHLGLIGRSHRVIADLPALDRDEARFAFRQESGLPQIDWDAADSWIGARYTDPDEKSRIRRAFAAAWLDELRDGLDSDHRRWRKTQVEGLAPMEGGIDVAIARAADLSISVITKALRPIRGDSPIPPIAIVGLAPHETYISFTSHFFPEKGSFATSGGLYIHQGGEAFPLLCINATPKWGAAETVAHELTHHALHACRLPQWTEEGITQMMEERVTNHTAFKLDRDIIARQRACWNDAALHRFISGSSFHSPRGDEQELSYHLAQWVVRSHLDRAPKEFFAFTRGCRTKGAKEACAEFLRGTPEDIVRRVIGP